DIVRHFTDLHRRGDAIAFLQYALNKRREQKFGFDSLNEVTDQLISLYVQAGDNEKADALRKELIKTLASGNDKEQAASLLRRAGLCYDAKDSVKGDKLINEWLSQSLEGEASSIDFTAISQTAQKCLMGGDNAKIAEKLVRRAYELALKQPNGANNLVWFN